MLLRSQRVLKVGAHTPVVTVPSEFAKSEQLAPGRTVIAGSRGGFLVFVRADREAELLALLGMLGRGGQP